MELTSKKAVISTAKKEPTFSIGKIVTFVILAFLSIIVLIPFFWMISSSVKANNQVFTVPIQWVPKEFHWDNYSKIWSTIPLLTFFKNTAFLSVIITIIQLFTSSFAAYGFSKLNFKGRLLKKKPFNDFQLFLKLYSGTSLL